MDVGTSDDTMLHVRSVQALRVSENEIYLEVMFELRAGMVPGLRRFIEWLCQCLRHYIKRLCHCLRHDGVREGKAVDVCKGYGNGVSMDIGDGTQKEMICRKL